MVHSAISWIRPPSQRLEQLSMRIAKHLPELEIRVMRSYGTRCLRNSWIGCTKLERISSCARSSAIPEARKRPLCVPERCGCQAPQPAVSTACALHSDMRAYVPHRTVEMALRNAANLRHDAVLVNVKFPATLMQQFLKPSRRGTIITRWERRPRPGIPAEGASGAGAIGMCGRLTEISQRIGRIARLVALACGLRLS